MTRWLAHHVTKEISLIELAEIQVLQNEEKRKNYCFVPRETRLDDVAGMFASQPLLEAALITQSGKESESLLGICTRSDVTGI